MEVMPSSRRKRFLRGKIPDPDLVRPKKRRIIQIGEILGIRYGEYGERVSNR